MWHGEASILTTADPARIWSVWTDVANWTAWNEGIEAIEIDGPFQAGTTFTMKPPGQEALRSTLTFVDPARGFVDETVLGDVTVVVDHRFDPLPSGDVRITYATDVTGPDAQAIGEMVTADFPEVLGQLKRLVET